VKYAIILSSLDGLIIFVMVNVSKVVSNLQKPPMFMLQFKTTILTNKYPKTNSLCVLKPNLCPCGKIFCTLARKFSPCHKKCNHVACKYLYNILWCDMEYVIKILVAHLSLFTHLLLTARCSLTNVVGPMLKLRSTSHFVMMLNNSWHPTKNSWILIFSSISSCLWKI